jgi:hypothetical protein
MKKYVIILLFLLLASFMGGCVPGEDLSLGDLIRLIQQVIESDEEGRISALAGESDASFENETGELVADNFYTLDSFKSFVDNFSSYEYQHSQSHPKYIFNDIVKYNYIGTENIDGVMADKIQIAVNTESYEDRGQHGVLELKHNHVYDLWLDQDGLILKVARDGVILTTGGGAVSSLIAPQGWIIFNYHLPLTSKVHREYVGWQLVNRSKINREIGTGPINVDALDFRTAEGERKYFEIANVNGKNIYIGIYAEAIVPPSEGSGESLRQYQVTRLIPR